MNLYCRPGSHSEAIRAASARAVSASRNSSTKRIPASFLRRPSSIDAGFGQRGGRLLFVDLRQREPDVDQHPVALPDLLSLQQADVDRPPDPAHVDLGQVGPVGIQLHHLARNAEAHQATRRRRFTALLTSPVTMPLPVWKACLRRPMAISRPDSM